MNGGVTMTQLPRDCIDLLLRLVQNFGAKSD